MATHLYWVGRRAGAGLSPGNSSDPFKQTGTAATEQIQRERGGRGVVKTEFPAWSKERPVTGKGQRAAAGRGLPPSREVPSRVKKKKKKAGISCLWAVILFMASSVIPQSRAGPLYEKARNSALVAYQPEEGIIWFALIGDFILFHFFLRVWLSRKVSFQTQKPSQKVRCYIWHKLDKSSLHVSEQQETHQEGTVYNTWISAKFSVIWEYLWNNSN